MSWGRIAAFSTAPFRAAAPSPCSAAGCTTPAAVWFWERLWCTEHGAGMLAGNIEDAIRQREEQALLEVAGSPI